MRIRAALAIVLLGSTFAFAAHAQPSDPLAGNPAPALPAQPQPSAVLFAKAHEMLARAKTLDDTARAEEKLAVESDKKIAPLRTQAADARKAVATASASAREDAIALAEQLEAELSIAELEGDARRKSAADHRKEARDLRERALRVARGEEKPASVASPTPNMLPSGLPAGIVHCRPPYWCSDDLFHERL